MGIRYRVAYFLVTTVFLLLTSCALQPAGNIQDHGLAYTVYDADTRLSKHAPVFIVEEAEKDYNRIGTVEAISINGEQKVVVNPDRPTVYASTQTFTTAKGNYTNLVYRIHFSKVPFSLVPFYLGAGNNVGLIVVATLDSTDQPVLYTLVHTCGCYLAFIPTSNLAEERWKINWQAGEQKVYGEVLPSFVALQNPENLLAIVLRSATHRVRDARIYRMKDLAGYKIARPTLKPLTSLESLVLANGDATSFYETDGGRKGYVKDSHKIWERLFISWWALDWRVGEDKKLGRDLDDGIVFYTSLKPWARDESDMRDFARFLRYWGWRL